MLDGTPYLLEGPAAELVANQLAEIIERVELFRRQGALDPGTLARLRHEWRVEQIHETLGIEGNPLDIQETQLVLMRGIVLPGISARDADEVLNMRDALDYLEQLAASAEPVTEQAFRELHSLIVGNSDGSGRYRTTEVEIVGAAHRPPLAVGVPAAVESCFAWLRGAQTPPLVTAAVVHAWLAHIHPFTDGNGRTTRALANLLLIREGYPIVLIRTNDRPRYYEALAASDDGDIAPLVELMIKRCGDSLRQVLRAREAETGLSEAVQRAQLRLEGEYHAWRQAMLLLVAEVSREANMVTEVSGGDVRLTVRTYDQVTLDDFRALHHQDKSGSGWLAAIRGRARSREAGILLWVGYRTPQMVRLARVADAGPAIRFSEADVTQRRHPFRPVTDVSPLRMREVVFDGDRFVVMSRWSGETTINRWGAAEFASKLLAEMLDGYLNAEVEHASEGGLYIGDATRVINDERCPLRARVASVEDPLTSFGRYAPEAGERQVGVSVILHNLGVSTAHIRDMIFALRDARDTLIEPYVYGEELQSELKPGAELTLQLVFDVPFELRVIGLRFAPDYHSAPVEWELTTRREQ